MTQTKRFLQALIWLGLLFGLIIGLIWLFGTFNRPQTASQLPQTTVPTVAVTTVSTPEPVEVRPILISPIATPVPGPHPAGILFESAGELYWQPVDAKAQPLASASLIPIEKSSNERISILSLSPDSMKVLLGKINPSTESEELLILTPSDGELSSLFGGKSLGLGTKVFGWHPDSKRIVYWDGGPIKLLNITSGEQTAIFDPQKAAVLPYEPQVDGVVVSPDSQLLITSFTLTGQGWEVWIAKTDGSFANLLFKSNYPIHSFSWSPDGKLVAFASGSELKLMDSAGKELWVIGRNFVGGALPAWSPNGQYLAFTSSSKTNVYGIRIVDIENNTEEHLTNEESNNEVLPAWSPDGTQVLYLYDWADERGALSVRVSNLDGSQSKQISSDNQPKRSRPFWIPAFAER